jgi:DNA-binding NarL/FixJ family response regulator
LLLLASHDTTFLRELRALLEGNDFAVAGEARSGFGAIRLARELAPVLTLVDLAIPDIGGVEVTETIVRDDPDARVLVLARSAELDEREVLDALLAGACGYLYKDAGADALVAGVRATIEQGASISPAMVTRLVAQLRDARARERVAEPPPQLTRRECEVLRLIALGHENAEIAAELRISRATVKSHVARVLEKLGLENRVQAAVFAVRHGLG